MKSKIEEFHTQKQLLNRYNIAAVLRSETVIDLVRREMKRLSVGVKVETQTIEDILVNEVLKREVIEGEKADLARKMVAKVNAKAQRDVKKPETNGSEVSGDQVTPIGESTLVSETQEPTPIQI
jgi:hypothetical protein